MRARPWVAPFALGIALASPAALAAAPTATVDPAHTSASFSVRHLTLTTVTGTIAIKDATIVLGDGNLLKEADATLDLQTIDTHETDRDNDLRSDHWFEVAKYPLMTFKSTKIEPGPGGTMNITGDLTFHGVTNPVTLAAKYEGSIKDQKGVTHLGYSATTTVDRTAWGLGPNFPPVVVGNDVTLTLELEAKLL
jgi:polyisoprenoid-binding protein YceI